MKQISVIERRGEPTTFPAGERIYMLEFSQKTRLPAHYRHWQRVVDSMLEGISTRAPVFLMVDAGYVRAGDTPRRPGLHVDGHWVPGVSAHGTPGTPPGHGRHHLPRVQREPDLVGGVYQLTGTGYDEAVILATTVTGAVAYSGDYHAEYGRDGEVDREVIRGMQIVPLLADSVWEGNAALVHESLPATVSGYRQVVRLNVPGWTPERSAS